MSQLRDLPVSWHRQRSEFGPSASVYRPQRYGHFVFGENVETCFVYSQRCSCQIEASLELQIEEGYARSQFCLLSRLSEDGQSFGQAWR